MNEEPGFFVLISDITPRIKSTIPEIKATGLLKFK
jgi:hypothetical protein